MDSLLKSSTLVLEDINNYQDSVQQPKSTILPSTNSSSSSSLRSQSPDFSSSFDRSVSRKSIEIDSRKVEKQRQDALNKSLEEISRELKEIEDCFTVAEEILQKEKERDKQLYDRERQRRTTPSDDPFASCDSDNSNSTRKYSSSSQRSRGRRSPPQTGTPTYAIYSPTNCRVTKSPTFCQSRLYFKNGKVGCEDAEKQGTNVNTTHQIVKRIIKNENEHPLVSSESVQKILSENLMNELSEMQIVNNKTSINSPTMTPSSNLGSESSTILIDDSEVNRDSDEKLKNINFKHFEVGTPIEEKKMSVIEPGTVLNEQYRRLSDDHVDKVPIPGHDNKKYIESSNQEITLHPEHHQFVRDRLHHLVNRFSDRTRRMRHRLEVPPTPSSSAASPSPSPPPLHNRMNQNDHNININSPNSRVHAVDCGYWICPIFCCRGHEEDGLDPQGRFYISWLFIVSISFLYNAWVIPLRSSFPFQTESNTPTWLTMDYCCDFIYLLDVLFVKHRIIYLENGFWQTRRRDTRMNYMKKLQFKMDVLSLMPLDFFYLKYGYLAVFLRVPRLLKIQSFWEFFKLLDRVIASPFMVRVAKTLTYMLYMIHLTACAYYAYSAYQGLGTNRWVFSGKGHPYVRCFAFATKTATSIGKNPKPDNEGELLFMTVAWLMGVFVFALLIGQIRDIIATATRSQSEYKQLVDETLEYMRRVNLPTDLQRKVKQWFTFTWEQQRTLDEGHIMDTLPANLKTDIAISVHLQTLSKVQLFAECDEALLRELVLKLRSVTFVPGDFVCKKGEVGKEMYIIKVGEVHVMGGPNNDEVLATLSEGSYFGEISLLAMNGAERNRRTADVRSKGFSNLFVLSKSDLNEALVHYPDAQIILKRRARSLMRKNAAREANRSVTKTEEVPDVVIQNPKRPPSPPLKFMRAVMQSLPKESFAVRLLTQGSRRIKDSSIIPKKLDADNNKNEEKSELLFSIQNELKNKFSSINLTDSEKKFILRETASDPGFDTSIHYSECQDLKCDVTVHREM